MDSSCARLKLVGNLQTAAAELAQDMLAEMGRGFASNREAWAMLKEQLEQAKKQETAAEKVHKEMWDAVRDRNGDAFTALAHELERDAADLTERWMEIRVMAKLAVEMIGWVAPTQGDTCDHVADAEA